MAGTFLITDKRFAKRFMRKIHARAFSVFLLLAIGIVSMGTAPSAYAAEQGASKVLRSGRSGSCIWEYVQAGDEVTLTIAPADGKEGTLDRFYWNRHFPYKEITKQVLVKGKVKVPPGTQFMFQGFGQARSFDLRELDVSEVTNMEGMFSECFAVTSLDLSTWDVSQVKSMRLMFTRCCALTSLNTSGWDVSQVVNLSWMFFKCPALISLDLSHWNVSKAEILTGMFADCTALTSLNLSNWDLSHAVNTRIMFWKCTSLVLLGMSGWDVSHVVDMRDMFSDCSALVALDLSKWRVSDKTAMENMFENTPSLKMIVLGPNFLIDDTAAFDRVGSSVGTKWMQVNLGESGTEADPKRNVFESPSELLAFHRDRTLRTTDAEAYVRVTPLELTISFSKGAQDVTGEMAPQVYEPWAVAPLSKNAYKRDGYVFNGWKDLDGSLRADEDSFENFYVKVAKQNEKVAQAIVEFVALWRKQ